MINEKHFNYVFGAITLLLIIYLVFFGGVDGGGVDKNSVLGMLGGISFNVSLLLGIGFGLQYFQLGTKRDIQAEIFDQNNIAVAIYQSGIWIALSLVIAKGLI